MANFSTIHNEKDYVNYAFDISARGIRVFNKEEADIWRQIYTFRHMHRILYNIHMASQKSLYIRKQMPVCREPYYSDYRISRIPVFTD